MTDKLSGISMNQEEKRGAVTHGGCGGQLVRLTDKPVQAGNNPGSAYLLYRCDRCGETKIVGGK